MALTDKGEVYTWGSNASGQVQHHKKNRARTLATNSDTSWRGGVGERIDPLLALVVGLEVKEMRILCKVGRTVIILSTKVQKPKSGWRSSREPRIDYVSVKRRSGV